MRFSGELTVMVASDCIQRNGVPVEFSMASRSQNDIQVVRLFPYLETYSGLSCLEARQLLVLQW